MKRFGKWEISIAIFIIGIVITMPFSSAQLDSNLENPSAQLDPDLENFEEEETGASIIVQVNSYEPRIVPSNVLEEDDAPIYAFLSATTLGSMLTDIGSATVNQGAGRLASGATAEPFYSDPEITSVVIRPTDEITADLIRGNPRYVRPRQYSLENLGYLMILLKQVETENELPEEVTLNMEAEIWFENAERLFSLIQQDLVLPLDADQDLWRAKPMSDYKFFGGKGYARASQISGNSAQLVIYSGSDRTWPYTGTPREIQTLSLNTGETSDFVRLLETGNLVQNTFRVQLLDVIDQTENMVKLAIESDGKPNEVIVARGSKILSGSEWTVSNIAITETDEGTKYEVTISSANDRKIISTTYPKGTAQQQEADPCENSPVLLGNLAEQRQEQRLTGNLNNSALINLDRLRQMDVKDFSTLINNVLPPGRYLTASNINSNSVTLRVDNLREQIPRGTGWIETAKTLVQVFFDEIRSRVTESDRQTFTLREGAARRVSVDDYTYIISVDDIEAQNVKVSVSRVRNLETAVTEIRPTVSISTTRPAEEIALQIKVTSKDFVYCTAIQQYKKIITDYQGITEENSQTLLSDVAAFQIGKIYEELGYPRLALQNYQKAIDNGRGDFLTEAQGRINSLQGAAEQGARTRKAVIQDNGREVHIRVGSVFGDPESKPKATLTVEGRTREFRIGDKIFTNDFEVTETRGSSGYNYNWRLKELSDDFIVIEKYATRGSLSTSTTSRLLSPITDRETINLRDTELIDDKPITLQNIDAQKFALIRIVPGTGRPLVSRSNFTLHIPIEKRGLQLTPNQIDNKINSTTKIIESLDIVINKLDDVVRVWKQVCLITFAYLTLKNSFLTGMSRTQARRLTLRGQDGNSGWNSYCQENSGAGKLYRTYDACINANIDQISRSIDESQEAIDQVNDEIEDYQDQPWFRELTSEYRNLDKYGEYTNIFNKENLRDYRYWQLMKEKTSYTELTGSQEEGAASYNFRREVDQQIDSFSFDQKLEKYNEAVSAIQSRYPQFDSMPQDERKQLFRDLINSGTTHASSEDFAFLGDLNMQQIQSLRRDERGVYANTGNGRVNLNEATVRDYSLRLEKEAQTNTNSANELRDEISRVNRNYDSNPRAPLISSQGQVYVDENKNFYVANSVEFSTGETSDSYASNARLEIYPDGRPYCVPSGDGNYVKILDFYQDDSPKTIQEWNVGKDKLLCTGDDVLIRHQSVLARPENANEQNRLLELAGRIGKKERGDVVSSSGTNFVVDDRTSRSQHNVEAPKCSDVMDPSDCQTLFGVCDPVMCPASRFNLNGKWQVDDVVQSGLVGSLVLGLHNFDVKEPVPICLTGVLAGLRNIKSILQGYVECLKTAQSTGKAVGICDTIRSVFTCELIWREASSILQLRGSLFKWVGETVFGQSEEGGEYLTLQDSFANVEDSVNFFTKEYATQAFAAYNSRSTEDIGSSLCKAAIYGKSPEIGQMIEQLSTPESPPQYIATLSVKPYSETLQESIYSVYYHIYAGENLPADYSVYLKNELGDVYYLTERCRGRAGHIEAGGMADSTMDCRAPKNFKEVCIMVNGNTKCGFGKVTTEFGLNYLNNLIVKGDVRKNIKSEEECIAGEPQGSPTLFGLGIASAIGLPYATEAARAGEAARDLSSTGIARVCSVRNPGTGTNPQDYKVVGTCGKDSSDRLLGNCWIDLRTFTIMDADAQLEISGQLEEQTLAAERERLGVTNAIDKTRSKTMFDEIEAADKSSCVKQIEAIRRYEDVSERSVSYEISGKSRLRIAEGYVYLANNCAKEDTLREYNRIIVELQTALQSVVNTFNNRIDTVRQENAGNSQAINSVIQTESTQALAQMNTLESDYNQKVELLHLQEQTSITVSSVVQEFKAMISSGETLTVARTTRNPIEAAAEEVTCSRCGDGALNQCDDVECHNLNANCYFYERVNNLLGIDIAEPVNNECHSCTRANDCSSFDSDRSKCQNLECTSQSGLRCTWLSTGSTGRCVTENNQPRTSQVDCSDCRRGFFGDCTIETCQNNGDSCYFTDGTFSDSCNSCSLAQSCEDFNTDKAKCNNYDSCTKLMGKRCTYNNAEEECAESLRQEGQSSAISRTATNTNIVTTPDYGTITLAPSTQCGSDDNCEFLEDVSKDERGRAIDMVLLHITEGRRAINTHNLFGPNGESSGLSVNYILDRPGNIIQEVNEQYSAHHTGIAENKRSVGIEISNSGAQCTNICIGSNAPDCSRSDCKSVSGKQALFEQFSNAQMKALVRLVSEILIRNNLDVSNIRQHGKAYENDECAPPGVSDARSDPGPMFDWCKFNRNVQAAIEQYRANSNSETTGTNVPQWTFINTGIGEDFTDIRYNSNINYNVLEVIGNYLKTKTFVTESQRQRFIDTIETKSREYSINPYVIAATIQSEGQWREASNEFGRRANGKLVCENSYGPMQCNAGLLPEQATTCGKPSRVSNQEELQRIKASTITIEGGINCGLEHINNAIRQGVTSYGEIRVRYIGYNLATYRANNRDPRLAFPDDDYRNTRATSWANGNALIKRLITDAQTLARASGTNTQTNTLVETGQIRKVAVMGDSITGWQSNSQARAPYTCNSITTGGTNYPVKLNNRCNNVEFTNLGISGQTTSQMLNRFDSQVSKCDYNEVIIMGGVNDLAGSTSIDSIKSNLASMYSKAKEKNMKVIAVTVLPWKGYSTWSEQDQRETEELNNWIMNEAENVDIKINAYSALNDPNNQGVLKPEFDDTGSQRPNYLHPDNEGQDAIANAIISAAYSNVCR